MENLCILNIGNTHVEILENGVLKSIPTQEFSPDMIPEGPCAAASVVPAVGKKISSVRPDIFWITKDTPGIPDLSGVEADQLGADRIANASMLLFEGILPAMTIDCGTAIDCEIVDGKGFYAGGTILPGRTLIRKALNLFTAQLPEIPLSGELPASFPGQGTMDDLRWGTDGALAAAVRDTVERTKALFPGKKLRIVFCGGDSDFFAKQTGEAENRGSSYTLSGIGALYRFNHSKKTCFYAKK